MRKSSIPFVIAVMIFSIFVFNACSAGDSAPAVVTINTGLNNYAQPRDSITRAAAPSVVTGITLTVSASDMTTIEQTIPLDTWELSLEVPAGDARQFDVMAETATAEVYYSGTALANLTPGASQSVSITMVLNEPAPTTTAVTIDLLLGAQSFQDAVTAAIGSYTLSISASDMETVEQSFTPGSSITVTAGSARSFSVTANVESGDSSAVLSWAGSTTADLTAGEAVSLTINMDIYETKIVIPDRMNYRVVQIDNMNDDGWVELTGALLADLNGTDAFSSSAQFNPYDVDFDSMGRIYIANNYGGSGMGTNCIIRIDNISGSNYLPFTETAYDYGVVALAIDRSNNYVYYVVNNDIYRNDYNGTSEEVLTISNYTIVPVRGIAVDDSGIIYIAGAISGGSQAIFRYDPASTSVTHTYTASLNQPWDVIVKDSYVYVADNYDGSNASENDKIIRLSPDLQYTDELHYNSEESDGLYGPHRFVAILNKRFYLIDEDESENETERIVAFADILGTNWETFDPSQISQSAFQFYNSC